MGRRSRRLFTYSEQSLLDILIRHDCLRSRRLVSLLKGIIVPYGLVLEHLQPRRTLLPQFVR